MKNMFLAFFVYGISLFAGEERYVGVFCAADEKVPTQYKEAAFELGKLLAESKHGLITGGGNSGLMNAVMNGFCSSGDPAVTYGIVPAVFKTMNVHHPKLDEAHLIWTNNIYERLEIFQQRCDVFVVLPGGYGTLHELMDFLVPKQWGLTNKKIIVVNIDHFWDPLLALFNSMVEKGALKKSHIELLTVVSSVEECLDTIRLDEGISQHQGLNERYWEENKS